MSLEGAHGVQLITVSDDDKLSVSEEAVGLLNKLPNDAACNLMFVFGNARSGKSFMLNWYLPLFFFLASLGSFFCLSLSYFLSVRFRLVASLITLSRRLVAAPS